MVPLIKCPSCGNDVSDAAIACPKCGHPLQSTGSKIDERDPVHRVGLILAFVILVGGVVWGIYSCQEQLSDAGGHRSPITASS